MQYNIINKQAAFLSPILNRTSPTDFRFVFYYDEKINSKAFMNKLYQSSKVKMNTISVGTKFVGANATSCIPEVQENVLNSIQIGWSYFMVTITLR